MIVFKNIPGEVLGICLGLVLIGILGVVPSLFVITGLLKAYLAQPPVQGGQSDLSGDELFWIFLTLTILFALIWTGWIFSGLGIALKKPWGWNWAMALCISSVILCIGFGLTQAEWKRPLYGCFVIGLCCYFLLRPSTIEHCGLAALGYSSNWRWIVVLVGVYSTLGVTAWFWLGNLT